MVAIAQLVEHWIVDPVVMGSIPISHPDILVKIVGIDSHANFRC